MKIHYKVNPENLNSKAIIEVFKSVGWNKDESNILEAFKRSYYILAYDQDVLVGFCRAISDGYYYTSIFDVVIKPTYQKKGIAKELMAMLTEKFKGTYFFLTYTDGNRAFYEKCGFKENPQSMWIPK